MAPFNELLRKYRIAAGLSQDGLARKAGLSTSAVSKLEQNKTDPSWSTVQRLAQALDVETTAFTDEELSIGGPAEPEEKPAPKRRRKE